MSVAFEFLKYLIVTHGYWATFGLVSAMTIPIFLIVLILFWKTAAGKFIDNAILRSLKRKQEEHVKGNRLRKQFTANVQEILQDLAAETHANRAILFEFSNGTTNLVGLPFLFMTAAAEVATPGLPLVSQSHQRLNTATIASFLTKLETEGSVFIDGYDIPEEYTTLNQIMLRSNTDSALFYSIQGLEEAIGFLVIITTKQSGHKLDHNKSLLAISRASQKISSMINYDKLTEIEQKKK